MAGSKSLPAGIRRPSTETSSASNSLRVARGEPAEQVPPGRRAKRHPLPLALDDHPHGDALHAAGRKLGPDLPPQQRRNFVAVEPVEMRRVSWARTRPSSMSRGCGQRVVNRLLGDFVKHQPMHRHFRLQHFAQMPTNGFPFAVFVRRQKQVVGCPSAVALSFETCDFLPGGTM